MNLGDVIRFLAGRTARIGHLLVLILAIAPALRAAAVEGQTVGGIHTDEKRGHRYRAPSIDERVEALSKSLDLTDAQKSAVKTILEHRLKELREARSAPSNDGRVMIDRIRAIEDSTVERIRATLNEEQRKKYEPLGGRTAAPGGDKSVEEWLKEIGPR